MKAMEIATSSIQNTHTHIHTIWVYHDIRWKWRDILNSRIFEAIEPLFPYRRGVRWIVKKMGLTNLELTNELFLLIASALILRLGLRSNSSADGPLPVAATLRCRPAPPSAIARIPPAVPVGWTRLRPESWEYLGSFLGIRKTNYYFSK